MNQLIIHFYQLFAFPLNFAFVNHISSSRQKGYLDYQFIDYYSDFL